MPQNVVQTKTLPIVKQQAPPMPMITTKNQSHTGGVQLPTISNKSNASVTLPANKSTIVNQKRKNETRYVIARQDQQYAKKFKLSKTSTGYNLELESKLENNQRNHKTQASFRNPHIPLSSRCYDLLNKVSPER